MKGYSKYIILSLSPLFLERVQTPFSIPAVGAAIVLVSVILALIKLNKKGKNLLFATYFGSLVLTGIYFSDWPEVYGTIITVCLISIPIIVTVVNYWLFARYFRK